MGKALGTPSTLIPYSVSSRRDRFQIIIVLPFTFVSHDIFNVKRINIYYKSIRPFGVYGHGLQVSSSYRGGEASHCAIQRKTRQFYKASKLYASPLSP